MKIGEIPRLSELLAEAIQNKLLPEDILDKDVNDIIELPDDKGRINTGHAYNGADGELPRKRMTLLIWAVEQNRDDIITMVAPHSDLSKRIPVFWIGKLGYVKTLGIEPTTIHPLAKGAAFSTDDEVYVDETISVFDYLITLGNESRYPRYTAGTSTTDHFYHQFIDLSGDARFRYLVEGYTGLLTVELLSRYPDYMKEYEENQRITARDIQGWTAGAGKSVDKGLLPDLSALVQGYFQGETLSNIVPQLPPAQREIFKQTCERAKIIMQLSTLSPEQLKQCGIEIPFGPEAEANRVARRESKLAGAIAAGVVPRAEKLIKSLVAVPSAARQNIIEGLASVPLSTLIAAQRRAFPSAAAGAAAASAAASDSDSPAKAEDTANSEKAKIIKQLSTLPFDRLQRLLGWDNSMNYSGAAAAAATATAATAAPTEQNIGEYLNTLPIERLYRMQREVSRDMQFQYRGGNTTDQTRNADDTSKNQDNQNNRNKKPTGGGAS